MEEEADIISRLPDNILHEILSFVDLKHAVRTSVLAKRWLKVWMSVPSITLSWSEFLEEKTAFLEEEEIDHAIDGLRDRFIGIVNKVFNRRDEYSNIEMIKLGFVMHNHILEENFNRWILEAVKLRSLQRLFSSCPLLESVIIRECDIQTNNQRNVIIGSDSLQTCILVSNRRTNLGSADQFLTYNTKISGPNAEGLRCTGFLTEDFSLENFSSLVAAHVKMKLKEVEADETAQTYSELPAVEKEVFAKRMMKVLGAVHNVQQLTLSSGFLEVLLQAPGILNGQPLRLSNLEILKLEIRFTRGCLRSIAYLLKISPAITALKLKSLESSLAEVGDDWEEEFLLGCTFSHLKYVEIKEVEACDNAVKFLRFLTKNSTVLEEVNLFFRSSDAPDRGRRLSEFVENLKKFEVASPSMQINFVKPPEKS
ncbi:F-box/LRR-repeat protein At5g02910-like [Papaver somniferum]|uniref:F-box/LRR-repeat protein At5g02910-like n=1 Tax=Papaver somniferum TaxID=3469 RepID=UPI000E6FB443|nr:F-box/LRR-repeat protein At5g02910-like [Papaver somniferum]